MTPSRGPDLADLLGRALGCPPHAEPERALRVAIAHDLPLSLTAAATRLSDSRPWQRPLEVERAALAARVTTLGLLRDALGPLLAHAAIGAPAWRSLAGADVDLLVTPDRFPELCRLLRTAGLIEVAWHRSPGRAAYVLLDDGVADLVDIETVAPDDLADGHVVEGFLAPRRDVAVRRLLRKVVARSEVRLRDLADAAALAPDDVGKELDRTAARGRAALRAAERLLATGPLPEPVPIERLVAGVEEPGAARTSRVVRAARTSAGGRGALVVLVGPAARFATALVQDLERAAVDVVVLAGPSTGRYLRALVRARLDPAVLVLVDPRTFVSARWPLRARLVVDGAPTRRELMLSVLDLLDRSVTSVLGADT